MTAKSSFLAFRAATPNTGARERDERGRANELPADFGDSESERVLAAAAYAVAREFGRQAARECFAELIRQRNSR